MILSVSQLPASIPGERNQDDGPDQHGAVKPLRSLCISVHAQPPANRGRCCDQKAAPHVLADERARIAPSPRETPAEKSRKKGPTSGQQQHEIDRSQKKRGIALSAKNLK